MSEKRSGKIFLTTTHHSDLTWQFSYEKYDELREQQLNLVMGFFSKYPEYSFMMEQSYVLQNYINRNPEKKGLIQKLVNHGEGNLELVGSFSIPDLNLCHGESFIRNCISGLDYYQKEFGVIPITARLSDAFGMPMQVPQILAQLGYRYLMPGRLPNAPSDLDSDHSFIWKGAADAQVVVVQPDAAVDKSSHLTNVPVMYNPRERFTKTLMDLQNTEGNILAYYMTEIELFDELFFEVLEEVNQNLKAKRAVTFGRFADYCKTIDESRLQSYQGEFNPTFTGCYTTRIEVKKKTREAENALFAAELASAYTGSPVNLTQAWAELALGQFHDAACGCHHDICNIDVHQKLDFAIGSAVKERGKAMQNAEGNLLMVMNPSGYSGDVMVETTQDALPAGLPVQKDGSRFCFLAKIPAHGVKYFNRGGNFKESEKHDPKAYKGETDYFTFDFTEAAPRIASKKFAHSVFGQSHFAELQFRHDNGSMWDEFLFEPPFGAEHQEETVTSVEEGSVFIKVTTKGYVIPHKKPNSGNLGLYWPGFHSLTFSKEYIFPLRQDYFKLRIAIDFAGCNTKISLRIPLEINPMQSVALYDTPFGAVQRKPYFEVPFQYEQTMRALSNSSGYLHAKGDYPALHWVDYRDYHVGLAVANSGTPGHQMVGKDMTISLLRSGTRTIDGTMYPQPGAMDNGVHTYEFAFSQHAGNEPEKALWLASVLNRKPVCVLTESKSLREESLVWFQQDNIAVSSIYPQGGSIIVRAYECFGTETKAILCCGEKVACYNADMKGLIGEEQDKGNILFKPYEIKTFALKNIDMNV
ncbi:MAG: glycosyl hydrolase-related protein [Clostridiales bacterium]|jgi:alpha-mannosidase|nr:glycosyl hydrolase-related protein [Clostridiales bacterium]